MKQKDIALIAVAAIISAILSVLLANFLIAPKKNQNQQAEVVEAITADFPKPDSKYFNKDSNNPTKNIKIGDDTNAKPFNIATQ